MKTGVCYYPEHWPAERWRSDAAHMKRLGLSHVRIGEFAWSRLEHADGSLHLDWLSNAIEILHAHELKVVLGTPTATPPRWMIDRYPDMLALDENLQVRNFGSRRHYCFSHQPYLDECKRIVTILAETFGQHPGVVAWQTDNEYGCHSTSISYSDHALAEFRRWCARTYSSIDALNTAWGNVFWSMEYDHFDQIDLPVGTVTESNPAHQLAFWRFSSDQIRRFNKAQVDIIRAHSPNRDVLHNFMGNFVEFDHHLVSKDLDVATWDNYPLGFLTRDSLSEEHKTRYARTGHPDSSAFHHDLYRGCCNGRWWVMEQQPGPVNWAPYNPSPLPGMVRLWGWEAFAHGAEVMSYFRWRQAPFAQEQTHTGLLLSNGDEDVASSEVAQLNEELQHLAMNDSPAETFKVSSDVAIVFSYAGIAMQDIQSPGGESFSALVFCQSVYSACRQWGLNVDIVAPDKSLSDYRLVIVCNHTEDDADFTRQLWQLNESANGPVIALFAGSGSRNKNYVIPEQLPPGALQSLIDIQVIRSESLPASQVMVASGAATQSCICHQWREHIRSPITPNMTFADGWGFHYESGRTHYINAIPRHEGLLELICNLATQTGLAVSDLGPDIRTQRAGNYQLVFNYGSVSIDLHAHLGTSFGLTQNTRLLIGNSLLKPADVAVWVVR